MKKFLFVAMSLMISTIILACGVAGNEESPLGIRFVMETDGTGCPASGLESEVTGNPKDQLPSSIASLNFILSNRNGEKLVTTNIIVTNNCNDDYKCTKPNSPSYQLFNVPTMLNMHLEVQALDANSKVIWVGHNYDVDVTLQDDGSGQEVVNIPVINVFMRRVGNLTFGYDCMEPTGRIFHSATVLRDQTSILLIGGGAKIYPDSCTATENGNSIGCDKIVATSLISLFDTTTGSFANMAPLPTSSKRAAHKSVLLANGYVLILGGASELQLLYNRDGRAYVQAEEDDIHSTAILYNPDGNTQLDDGTIMKGQVVKEISMLDVKRMAFTITPLDANEPYATKFLMAGGWGKDGRMSDMMTVTLDPSTGSQEPSFTPLVNAMKAPRAWHTATKIAAASQTANVLFYGGADAGTDAPAEKFVGESSPTELLLQFGNFSTWYNFSHHAAIAMDSGQKVLITGGMVKDNEFSLTQPQASALLIDFTINTATFVTMYNPRAFHSSMLMPNGQAAILGGVKGGFTDEGVTTMEAFDADSAIFGELIGSTGSGLKLFLGRMGHTTTVTQDGAAVMIGGAYPTPKEGIQREKTLLQSAEIFLPVQ